MYTNKNEKVRCLQYYLLEGDLKLYFTQMQAYLI